MYHMLHSKHKMTTEKQYSLLKSKMSEFLHNNKNCLNNKNPNGTLKYKQHHSHWTELTEKLNKIGPPYRTIQEWKKVWCDFKRSERKRRAKSKLKLENIKKYAICDNEVNEADTDETILDTTTTSALSIPIKTENLDYENNSESIYSTYSNEYDNDYSYPDENSLHERSHMDENLTSIPNESSSGSNAYASHRIHESIVFKPNNQATGNKQFCSLPPLQPANAPMLNQSFYTLYDQMEHQTKLLGHLSEMSSTMAGLMERQVDAVEKQTEAMKRQALATERHTSVMNTFIDMIREKMFKDHSNKKTADDIV